MSFKKALIQNPEKPTILRIKDRILNEEYPIMPGTNEMKSNITKEQNKLTATKEALSVPTADKTHNVELLAQLKIELDAQIGKLNQKRAEIIVQAVKAVLRYPTNITADSYSPAAVKEVAKSIIEQVSGPTKNVEQTVEKVLRDNNIIQGPRK